MNKIVLLIRLSEDGKQYDIKCDEGVSVNEMMFGVAAAIRCMVRDNVIKTHEVATDMINRYLTDEQFAEVKDTNETDKNN